MPKFLLVGKKLFTSFKPPICMAGSQLLKDAYYLRGGATFAETRNYGVIRKNQPPKTQYIPNFLDALSPTIKLYRHQSK